MIHHTLVLRNKRMDVEKSIYNIFLLRIQEIGKETLNRSSNPTV